MKGTVVTLFVTISATFSQVVDKGKCPDVQLVKNFNESEYLGKWYQAERYYNIYEIDTICNTVSYALESNGSVAVVNEAIQELYYNETRITNGTANFAKDGLGEFEVYIPSLDLSTKYSILGIDYKNYASLFSCVQIGNLRASFAWLLTRSQNASSDVISAAKKAFEAQNITTSPLIIVNKDCSFLERIKILSFHIVEKSVSSTFSRYIPQIRKVIRRGVNSVFKKVLQHFKK